MTGVTRDRQRAGFRAGFRVEKFFRAGFTLEVRGTLNEGILRGVRGERSRVIGVRCRATLESGRHYLPQSNSEQ